MVVDIIDELAGGIKADVIETCAKVAELHRYIDPLTPEARGYNRACTEIAAKIRQLSNRVQA